VGGCKLGSTRGCHSEGIRPKGGARGIPVQASRIPDRDPSGSSLRDDTLGMTSGECRYRLPFPVPRSPTQSSTLPTTNSELPTLHFNHPNARSSSREIPYRRPLSQLGGTFAGRAGSRKVFSAKRTASLAGTVQ
jgi:hypothetical protein